MYNLIQRNKKKLLAFFGVLLMIAFTLPSSNLLNNQRRVMEGAYGHTATRTITRGEYAQAHFDWDLLSRTRTYIPEAGGLVPYTMTLGPTLAKQINDHPDLYVLLQEEARSLGLGVSDDRVEDAINRNPFFRSERGSDEFQNAMRGFLLVESYINRLSSAMKATEPRVQHYIDSAALQVRANLAELTAEQFKPTGAIPDAALQAHFDKYVHHTPAATGPSTAPTTAPATATSPSTSPATTSAADSLTFDYKYPDRVKFQYLAVDVKQLRSIVRKTKDENRWDVDARKYYLTHESEFPPKPVPPPTTLPTTSPATAPAATAPATSPAPAAATPPPAAAPAPAAPAPQPAPTPSAKPAPGTPEPSSKDETELEKPRSSAGEPIEDRAVLAADVQPAAPASAAPAPATKPAASGPASAPSTTQAATAATAPTTRPYAEVKEEILDKLMEPEVKKVSAQLVDKIAQRLTADFAAYRKLDAAAQKAPGSYGTSEYLERVAGEIEKEQGVRPAVVSKSNDWTAVNELWKADAELASAAAGQERVEDLARTLPAFGGKTLQLLEFTKPLTTPQGGLYFLRFTDAEKSHEPATLAEVKDRVEADVRVARGYAAAKANAEKVLADAQLRGLASAAASASAKFTSTGTFNRQYGNQMSQFAFMPIPGYAETDPDVKTAMVNKAFELADHASKNNPHPRGVLDLPEQRKVMVIELNEITRPFSGPEEVLVNAQVRATMPQREVTALVDSYLTYDAVKARLGYRLEHPEDERKKEKDADAAAGQ